MKELKKLNQFMVWKTVTRKGKTTKPPYAPWKGTDKPVDATNPDNWTSYDVAKGYVEKGEYEGISFVVTPEDNIVGIDLDHHVKDGKPSKTASEIIKKVGSNTEISPSNKGIRIFATVKDKKRLYNVKNSKENVEIYIQGRHLSVTENHLEGTPTEINDATEAIEELIKQYSVKPQHNNLLETIKQSNDSKFLSLWNGNTSSYDSHSEADQALMNKLAFWCAKDAVKMEEMFSQSGLNRKKWQERPDYRKRTIETAIAGCTEVYNPQGGKEVVVSNPLATKNLAFSTEHLPYFAHLDKLTRLQGKQYLPIKKVLYYQCLSLPIRTQLVWLGDINTDLRVHAAYAMPSGSGKGNLIDVQRQVTKELGYFHSVPTSYHPEALVGKTIRRGQKNPVYEEIKGPLSEPWVTLNEAINIFRSNSDKEQEIRKYLNIGLDTYKSNEIVKRMTDLPREEALHYTPDCLLTIFMQPIKVGEEVVQVGTLRRCIMPYVNLKSKMDPQAYNRRVDGGSKFETLSNLRMFTSFLKEVKVFFESSGEFVFEDAAKERFKELHLDLVLQGFAHSISGQNYTRIVEYDMQDKLVKLSCLQAAIHKRWNVTTQDVEYAFVDLTEFFACTLDYVEHKVMGKLDYGEGWHGATGSNQECLKWLYEQGAVSFETSKVSISDFIDEIAKICKVEKETARRKLYTFEKNDWVKGKQIGQYDSKIWISFPPDETYGTSGIDALRAKIKSNSHYTTITSREVRVVSENPQKCHFGQKSKYTGAHPGHPYHPKELLQKEVQGVQGVQGGNALEQTSENKKNRATFRDNQSTEGREDYIEESKIITTNPQSFAQNKFGESTEIKLEIEDLGLVEEAGLNEKDSRRGYK